MKKTNPFKLRDFQGVNQTLVEILARRGIKTTTQMLTAAAKKGGREILAHETGIPLDAIIELVRLSDLARLPGVKGIRARLYHDAGIDSIEKFAAAEAETLRLFVTEYVERTGFNGIPPLPKEVSSTIENARKLEIIVER